MTDTNASLAVLTREIDTLVNQVTHDATADLGQAQHLFSQAMGELTRSFSVVAGQSQAREDAVAALAERLQGAAGQTAGDQQLAAVLATLHDSGSAIREGVDDALRALQFEDMVRQIMEHIAARLHALTRLTANLAQQGATLACHQTAPECTRQLRQLSEDIAQGREQLRRDDHRAVTQQSMASGAVELF